MFPLINIRWQSGLFYILKSPHSSETKSAYLWNLQVIYMTQSTTSGGICTAYNAHQEHFLLIHACF